MNEQKLCAIGVALVAAPFGLLSYHSKQQSPAAAQATVRAPGDHPSAPKTKSIRGASLTADTITTRDGLDGTRALVARGHVHIAFRGIEIASDVAHYHPSKGRIEVAGQVTFKDARNRVRHASAATLDLTSGAVRLSGHKLNVVAARL